MLELEKVVCYDRETDCNSLCNIIISDHLTFSHRVIAANIMLAAPESRRLELGSYIIKSHKYFVQTKRIVIIDRLKKLKGKCR